MVAQCWLADRSIEDFLPKRHSDSAARAVLGMQGWIIGCAVMAVQFWLSCTHEVQYRTEQLVASWSSSRQSGLLNQSTVKARRGEDINDKATARFFACHLVARAGS
jgi:hypothetical protein